MEIISILRTIKDPRREHLREHSFECIFYIAMAAVIGGAESWYEVADFGKMHEAFFSSRIRTLNVSPPTTHSIVYFPFCLQMNLRMGSVRGYVKYVANTVGS